MIVISEENNCVSNPLAFAASLMLRCLLLSLVNMTPQSHTYPVAASDDTATT